MERDLLTLDQSLRAEADGLLEAWGLRSLLEDYAPIHLTGSYALGLMVWRDLDIVMDAPHITVAEFFALGNRITARLSPGKCSLRTIGITNGQVTHGVSTGVFAWVTSGRVLGRSTCGLSILNTAGRSYKNART